MRRRSLLKIQMKITMEAMTTMTATGLRKRRPSLRTGVAEVEEEEKEKLPRRKKRQRANRLRQHLREKLDRRDGPKNSFTPTLDFASLCLSQYWGREKVRRMKSVLHWRERWFERTDNRERARFDNINMNYLFLCVFICNNWQCELSILCICLFKFVTFTGSFCWT
mmetsp:Transcript_14543/g.24060  ORF Transcript_14543/g.24060 Transcript_14543/m.24060 type:complete len:166 (-) Transcript_14543:238-735(-)